jgi:MFS family permease
MNRQELSAASSIGLLYLIRMLGLFMVLPVLPVVAPSINGATPLLIGLAIGVYGLSQAMLQIPFGLLSDVFGRKTIIAGGLTLFIVGSFVAGLSESIVGVILGRFLQGCGAIASTLLALMSDLTRVDQRGKSMAIVGIAIGSSFGLALVLGPWIGASWGLSGVFNLSGLLGLVGLVVLFALIPSPQVMSVNLDASFQKNRLLLVLKDLVLWRMNISVFFLHFLLVSGFSVFPMLLADTGQITSDDHSIYYLVLLTVSFILMLPFMRLFDRMPDGKPMMLIMVAFAGSAFSILGLWQSYLMVLAGMALFFMAFNLLEVVLPAQLSKIAAAGTRGTAMGVYTTCQFLGIFAGGVVSGLVLTLWDISAVMVVNVSLTLAWFGLLISFPSLGRIGSRTVALGNLAGRPANERIEGLLSVDGVVDAVIIESDQVAYLKVDEQKFDDRLLDEIVGQNSNA